MHPSHYDISLLVFLVAAAISHFRVSREHPEHVGIFRAIAAIIVANVGMLLLWPSPGLLPITFALAVPGACLYGVCATHGFRARLSVVFTGLFVALVWACSFLGREEYVWSLVFSWFLIAGITWVCLLDPDEPSTGITRASAVALASSLLADIPGVYAWAHTGSWRAESVITSLSVTILATLPTLWRLRTCRQSSSGHSCSVSGSSSDGEAEARPPKPCE